MEATIKIGEYIVKVAKSEDQALVVDIYQEQENVGTTLLDTFTVNAGELFYWLNYQVRT